VSKGQTTDGTSLPLELSYSYRGRKDGCTTLCSTSVPFGRLSLQLTMGSRKLFTFGVAAFASIGTFLYVCLYFNESVLSGSDRMYRDLTRAF
jgi:hypothetical protein